MQGIWNDLVKPLWSNTIAPFLTDTVAPWVMNTVLPGIASATGSALKFIATDIIVPVIESAISNIGKLISGAWDGVTGTLKSIWNKVMPESDNTNAGVVATVDTQKDVNGNERDMTQPSNVKSKDGKVYTWQELEDLKAKYKPGDILDAYNAEGAQMYIGEDGEIKAKDESSEWDKPAKVISRAAWHSFVNPEMGMKAANFLRKTTDIAAGAVNKMPVVGPIMSMVTKAGSAPISGTMNAAAKLGNFINDPMAALAKRTAEKAGVSSGWLGKVVKWCQGIIDNVFANEKVIAVFNKISEFLKWPSKQAEKIFSSIKEGFKKLFNKSVEQGSKQATEQVITDVNTI